MGQLVNLLGGQFGRLTVVEKTNKRGSSGAVFWKCLCECGKTKDVSSSCLRTEQTKSCGCLFLDMAAAKGKAKHKHGMTNTSTYRSWGGMKQRCYNPNNKKYHRYGALGITVCDEWFNSFQKFLDDMGECPKGMSIDRIDVSNGYYKENCRWATQKEQQNNRSNNVIITVGESPMTMSEYCSKHGLNSDKVQQRLKRGWSQEKAVSK
jgi:hypothetical protein